MNTTTRPPTIRAYFGPDEISAVLFAGLGGSSLGELAATGRSPDIAINHWDVAIAVHKANHPNTRHYVEDVFSVDPREVTEGRPVALLWLSPDCTHHSKAKGGKPRDRKIRSLAWSAIPWAKLPNRPRVIMLENVEEFFDWGPLDRKTGQPIKARKGQTYRAWQRKLERLGYVVEKRILRACDYGTPTKRRRGFVIARCDGRTIVWPTPTHGPMAKPYRTAGDCIDWTIACPSIFDRDRPLVAKTLARVARGADKFVLRAAEPYIVCLRGTEPGHVGASAHSIDEPLRTVSAGGIHHYLVSPYLVAVNHGGAGRNDLRVHDLAAPMPTVTGAQRGEHALVVPYLVHRSNGERVGQAPRIYDVQEPLGTIVAQGQKHALCAAFLAKHYSERPTGGWNGGAPLDAPMDTITNRDHHSLVAGYLCRYNGDVPGAERVASLDEPLTTLDASRRFALVASFLARYNGQSKEQSLADPLTTIDTKDRFALVEALLELAPTMTPAMESRAREVAAFLRAHGYDVPGEFAAVTVAGIELVVWDLGMRMLVAAELAKASGFPDGYRIDIGADGEPITKTDQIRLIGNAVPPQWPEELIAANFSEAAA